MGRCTGRPAYRLRAETPITAIVLALLVVLPLAGQSSSDLRDSVTVVAGSEYAAVWLHGALLGEGYRSLWTTPIRVPVADLATLGGGLTPVREGGGVSTRTLHMAGADGRRYVFRSVAKTPGDLTEDLEGTPLAAILQDQVASFHPTAAPIVARLLDAVGVLHPDPRYVVIPDDPRLEEFRADFAGMLTLFEERPDDRDGEVGFAGSRQIVQLGRLFEILEEEPDSRIDAVELLRSRLVDLMVGDRDRSHNNHLWARLDDGSGGSLWRVIPRDRDQAFVRFDGVLKKLARTYDHRLVTFSDAYPDLDGLTRNAWDMDRGLLVGIDRATWEETVREVQAALTDDVISGAVVGMPAEHQAILGEELAQSLRLRRDHLPEAAEHLYGIVFGVADIHTTDAPEDVTVRSMADGSLSIRVRVRGRPVDSFSRTFDPGETSEIRLYLHGGDDETLLEGSDGSPIRLRVIGGGGSDRFQASPEGFGGHAILYDEGDDSEFLTGPDTRVRRRSASRPFSWYEDTRDLDWGSANVPEPRGGYDADRGLLLVAGFKHYRYGFLKTPYRSRTRLRAGWAFGPSEPVLDVRHVRRGAIGSADLRVWGRWSGIEILDYYGQGNEAGPSGPLSFHRVTHKQATLAPALGIGDGGETYVEVGPILRYTSTDTVASGSFIAATEPYGSGRFAQLGLRAAFQSDGRDEEGMPTRGYLVFGGASVYPSLLDVDRGAFGEIHGQAAAYFSPASGNPTLALRAGGKKVWGNHPFAESAFLGGATDLRGLREQRYAGSASLFGSAELRVFLARVVVLLPMDVGVFGLADAGRVFARGESSSTWHEGFGGGVWFAPLNRSTTFQLSVARSEARTAVIAGVGFAF